MSNKKHKKPTKIAKKRARRKNVGGVRKSQIVTVTKQREAS